MQRADVAITLDFTFSLHSIIFCPRLSTPSLRYKKAANTHGNNYYVFVINEKTMIKLLCSSLYPNIQHYRNIPTLVHFIFTKQHVNCSEINWMLFFYVNKKELDQKRTDHTIIRGTGKQIQCICDPKPDIILFQLFYAYE